MSTVRLSIAARELGKNPSTLRRWIAEGAPCVSPGEPGRGNGALVDLDALRRWRVRESAGPPSRGPDLQWLAGALLDFYMRNSGNDEPAHRTVGIPDRQAAFYLALAFEYVAQRLTGRNEELPAEIKRLVETARK